MPKRARTFLLFFPLLAACTPEPRGPAPPSVAHGDTTRWAQYCMFQPTEDLKDVNAILAQQGRDGWELVAVPRRNTFCFKKKIVAAE